jgi:hypothetical protein
MNQEIQILDLKFKPYISAAEIDTAVTKIAAEIDREYFDSHPIFVYSMVLLYLPVIC